MAPHLALLKRAALRRLSRRGDQDFGQDVFDTQSVNAAGVTAIVCTCVIGGLAFLGLAYYIYKKRSSIISCRKRKVRNLSYSISSPRNNERKSPGSLSENGIPGISVRDFAAPKVAKPILKEEHDSLYEEDDSFYFLDGQDSLHKAHFDRVGRDDLSINGDAASLRYPSPVKLHADDSRFSMRSSTKTLQPDQISIISVSSKTSTLKPDHVSIISVASDASTLLPDEASMNSMEDAEQIISSDQVSFATAQTTLEKLTDDNVSVRTLRLEESEEDDTYQLELNMSHSFQLKPMVERLSMVGR